MWVLRWPSSQYRALSTLQTSLKEEEEIAPLLVLLIRETTSKVARAWNLGRTNSHTKEGFLILLKVTPKMLNLSILNRCSSSWKAVWLLAEEIYREKSTDYSTVHKLLVTKCTWIRFKSKTSLLFHIRTWCQRPQEVRLICWTFSNSSSKKQPPQLLSASVDVQTWNNLTASTTQENKEKWGTTKLIIIIENVK